MASKPTSRDSEIPKTDQLDQVSTPVGTVESTRGCTPEPAASDQPSVKKSAPKQLVENPTLKQAQQSKSQKGQDAESVKSSSNSVHKDIVCDAPSPSRSVNESTKEKLPSTGVNMILPHFDITRAAPAKKLETAEPTATSQVNPQHGDVLSSVFNTMSMSKRYLSEKIFGKSGGSDDTGKKRGITYAIIGLHGYYPTNSLVIKFFGEQTGTSEKLCSQMLKAVKQHHMLQYGEAIDDANITIMPVKALDKARDRVMKHFSQLCVNAEWSKSLSEADVVLVGAHSQGAVVAASLMAHLIRHGHISPSVQKVGLLTLAGICHGPGPLSRFVDPRLLFAQMTFTELFEFRKPDSELSQEFRKELKYIMDCGVHVTAIGNIDDPVVPLYSALIYGVKHPNLLRAVYIDSHKYTSGFFTNLVAFLVKLRNYGLSDHDLLPLVTDANLRNLGLSRNTAHSTIYEEVDVYSLAIDWTILKDKFDLNIRSSIASIVPNVPYLPGSYPRHWLSKAFSNNISNRSLVTERAAVPPAAWRLSSFFNQPPEQPAVLVPSVPKEEDFYHTFEIGSEADEYVLPFKVRGLLDDAIINSVPELRADLVAIYHSFHSWNPPNKEWKRQLQVFKAKI